MGHYNDNNIWNRDNLITKVNYFADEIIIDPDLALDCLRIIGTYKFNISDIRNAVKKYEHTIIDMYDEDKILEDLGIIL